jgi:hypothetical protein
MGDTARGLPLVHFSLPDGADIGTDAATIHIVRSAFDNCKSTDAATVYSCVCVGAYHGL